MVEAARHARVDVILLAGRYWLLDHAAALQFVLAHPCVVSAVLGLRNREEVGAAMQGYRESIADGFWSDLKGEGLIAPDAPTPAAPRRVSRSN